ncbi:MAG: methylmalonyl Co-A mutase-associated GTPase MeaB [Truepera sp.]|nr:methylmalonyl Co-A mutase-associated GTPase MeaB [Truepera sp.]
MSLVERFLGRDERALARAISLAEAGSPVGQVLLAAVRARATGAPVVGVTGSPGSGKSTLIDQLIGAVRERGERVAVVTVDPTSPYSGGAIMGDRIRMMGWYDDPGVYIRSMATRGRLGGLAGATLQVVTLLDAYGFDRVFVETVGVGQSEVDIVELADTTILVLTPEQGDGVQALKAGIMEVADLFCVNKYDRPGGDRLKREVEAALEFTSLVGGAWRPPVLETVATRGEGTGLLMEYLDRHIDHLKVTGQRRERLRRRARAEVSALLNKELKRALSARDDGFVDEILKGRTSLRDAVLVLLAAPPVGSRVD